MSSDDFRTAPIDPTSSAQLAERGLRFDVLTTDDRERFAKWAQAMTRGFHGAEAEDENVGHMIESIGDRRVVGVWDDAALDPDDPVATSSAWPVEMTVPGERVIESWAISTVTVAPTHRRRGIARNLLEAELRTAAGLGIPIAILTVSESTIYGRFGFAPGAWAGYPKIEAKRARWIGPTPAGRLDIIPRQRMRDEIDAFYDRVRLLSPGQIVVWPRRWDQIIGLIGDAGENRKRRVVRYTDDDGVARGYAIYKLAEDEEDFTKHTLTVDYLLTETPDASAAIWRYLLELDLVSEVRGMLRPIDEPLPWQIADWRSTQTVVEDHLWLRVLDVAATFEGRDYLMAGRLGFEVSDELGFTSGRWLLSVDETGTGSVADVEEFPEDVPALALSINELSALYLGGVSAVQLADAERLRELTPGATLAADAILRAARAPWLSVWF